MKKHTILLIILMFLFSPFLIGQEQQVWHNIKRKIHYKPKGKSFVLQNGERKFNRALYGTNTGFRVETGDLPEFAMYMPGMGGNLKLGIANGDASKWITEADSIATTYTPGTMQYVIHDPILETGSLHLQVVALPESEGFILKIEGASISKKASIFWTYGGASGKKFSRNGDIGGDPESVFYLQPKYCINNHYTLSKNSFTLAYGSENNKQKNGNNKKIKGVFPSSKLQLGSALHLQNPLAAYNSKVDSLPIITGKFNTLDKGSIYIMLKNDDGKAIPNQQGLEELFAKGLQSVEKLARRINIKTPDPYLNTLGGVLATAADGIWEDPAFLHGAVAWRMHLNAWRGAYVADPLGWHDRAKTHLKAYGNSQVITPEFGPIVPDTTRNLARQEEKIGNAMFSSGYISRHPNKNTVAHHYDMNLVFIDQLNRHFKWTGDIEFLKEMWPVIERHLAWEKRNYDVDGDGLYDAYAAIWASDGLQYSGGGVTYTSAYNFYANKMAARLAEVIGENSAPYLKEAEHIYNAIQDQLWVADTGVFAEYKDLLGNQRIHETPGIWTIYHALDKEVPNPFQAYTSLNYITTNIPHIPVAAEGLEKDDLQLISTTNWQPYTWSVNNVALAEILHTSLAYWQGGQSEKAFKLWESGLVESMYLGASPGALEQLLFYDAIRGELYRDFADPVGMTARSMVEGLFGILPNAIENTLTIKPGFPNKWNSAAIDIPDVSFKFEREGNVDMYQIKSNFEKQMPLQLLVKAQSDAIYNITINSKKVNWQVEENTVGMPLVKIESPASDVYQIRIEWTGNPIEKPIFSEVVFKDDVAQISTDKAAIIAVKNADSILNDIKQTKNTVSGKVKALGNKTFFLKLQQEEMIWWHPITLNSNPRVEVINSKVKGENISIEFKNNQTKKIEGVATFNAQGQLYQHNISLTPNTISKVEVPVKYLVSGTNTVDVLFENEIKSALSFINWDIPIQNKNFKKLSLDAYFNSKVTDIFENKYLTPRAQTVSLQLPTQGIGNWCYPLIKPSIDDTGLREKAGSNNEITTAEGISFTIPSDVSKLNTMFTSQWDNYPKEIKIPLSGKASHMYLLMVGSTNHMQSRFVNGEVIVGYTDGSFETLSLKNPENWWPIEQDYYIDGYAFTTDAPKPPRVHLKTGLITRNFKDYKVIKGFSDFGVEGGAATILDIPLSKTKTLNSLELKATANEVVIGIMGITLIRE